MHFCISIYDILYFSHAFNSTCAKISIIWEFYCNSLCFFSLAIMRECRSKSFSSISLSKNYRAFINALPENILTFPHFPNDSLIPLQQSLLAPWAAPRKCLHHCSTSVTGFVAFYTCSYEFFHYICYSRQLPVMIRFWVMLFARECFSFYFSQI